MPQKYKLLILSTARFVLSYRTYDDAVRALADKGLNPADCCMLCLFQWEHIGK